MTPVGRLEGVAIDCGDPEPLVEFWSNVLGVEVKQREDDWIVLAPPSAGAPHLAFQTVPEPKVAKNRLHLDLAVDDLRAAVDAVETLGATRVGSVVEEDGGRFQVMADPGGNEFCLIESDPPKPRPS